MLNRRLTRCVLNSDEITASLASVGGTAVALVLQTTDSFYVGFHGKFSSRYISVNTANSVASVLSVTYWDGSAWTAVDDLVDQTAVGGKTLAQSGFISWINKDDWAKSAVTGVDADVELYWVKLTVSVNLHAATKINNVLNLFSDDQLLRAYYPELISDTQYLPSGRTNFIEQHMAAKDLVVLRCKQRKLITDESQIVDASTVAMAAVHACAYLIYAPIATSDDSKTLMENAQRQMNLELSSLTFAVDVNNDGIVSDAERSFSSTPMVSRR